MEAESSGKEREIPASGAAATRQRAAAGLPDVHTVASAKPQKLSQPKNTPRVFPCRSLQNSTDKSLKGSIDADLYAACRLINDSADFRTTSCCSGRIVVFRQAWTTSRVKAARPTSRASYNGTAGALLGTTADAVRHAAPSDAATVAFAAADPVAAAAPSEQRVPDHPTARENTVATKHGGRIVYASHTVVDDVAACAEILRRLETGAVHYEKEETPERPEEPAVFSTSLDNHTVLTQVASSESFSFADADVPPALPPAGMLPRTVGSYACDRAPPSVSEADTVSHTTCLASGGRTPSTRRAAEESSRRVDRQHDALSDFRSDQPLVYLKVEPLILHIECATYADATALLAAAVSCGLKQSGLSAGKKRFIVAIRGSQRLEIPVAAVMNKNIEETFQQAGEDSASPLLARAAPAGLAKFPGGTSRKHVKAGIGGDSGALLFNTTPKSSSRNGATGHVFAEAEEDFMGSPAGEDWVDLAPKHEETSSGTRVKALQQQDPQEQQPSVPGVDRVTVLVTEDYLRFALRVCNEKLNKNKAQIDRLETTLKSFLQQHATAAEAAASRPLATTAGARARAKKTADLSGKRPAVSTDFAAEEVSCAHSAGAIVAAATAPAAALPDASEIEQEKRPEKQNILAAAEGVTTVVTHHYEKRHGKFGSPCNDIGAWKYLPDKGLDDPRRLDLWGCACAFFSPYLCIFGGMARGRRVNTLLTFDVTTCGWTVRVPQGGLERFTPVHVCSFEREVCGDTEEAKRGKRYEGEMYGTDEEVEKTEGKIEGREAISPPGRWRHAACVQRTEERPRSAARAAASADCAVRCGREGKEYGEEKEGLYTEVGEEATDQNGNTVKDIRKGTYAEGKGGCVSETVGAGGARGAEVTAKNTARAWAGRAAGDEGATAGNAALRGAAKENKEVPAGGRGTDEVDGYIATAVVEERDFGKERRETHVVWVYGGVTGAQPVDDYVLDDLWRLNLSIEWRPCEDEALTVRGRWTRVAAAGKAPPALHSHAMAATEENLLLLGGIQKSDSTAAYPLDFRRIYILYFASLSWRYVETEGIPVPVPGLVDREELWGCMRFPRRRFSHSALLVEGTAATASEGGARVSPLPVTKDYTLLLLGGCDGSVATSDIWLLDLRQLRWRFLSDLPHANSSWRCRSGVAAFKEKKKIHLFLVGGGGICFTFGSHADPPIHMVLQCSKLFVPSSPDIKKKQNKKEGWGLDDSDVLPLFALSSPQTTSSEDGGAADDHTAEGGVLGLYEVGEAAKCTSPQLGRETREDQQRGEWELLKYEEDCMVLPQAPGNFTASCLRATAAAGAEAGERTAAAGEKEEEEGRGSMQASGKGAQRRHEEHTNNRDLTRQKETSPAAALAAETQRQHRGGGYRPRHAAGDGAAFGPPIRGERKERFSFRDCVLACMQQTVALSSAQDDHSATTSPDREAAAAAAVHPPVSSAAAAGSNAAAPGADSRRAAAAEVPLSGKYERLGDVLLLPLQDYQLLKTRMEQLEYAVVFARRGDAAAKKMCVLSGAGVQLRAYSGAAAAEGRGRCVEKRFWQLLAEKMKVRGIGVQQGITGPERRSNAFMLHGEVGLVNHRENGVIYHFDITRCMFASGNGTERRRFASLINEGGKTRAERVVDLFCGIGYFSLAALTHVPPERLQHVYACDWNGEALGYFKESLRLNGIDPARVSFFNCNSFLLPCTAGGANASGGGSTFENTISSSKTSSAVSLSPAAASRLAPAAASQQAAAATPLPAALVGVAHRVSLGLLPSCMRALRTALLLLNTNEGGVLHVHGVAPAIYVHSDSATSSIPFSSPHVITSCREYVDVEFGLRKAVIRGGLWLDATAAVAISAGSAAARERNITSSCAGEAGSISFAEGVPSGGMYAAATDIEEDGEDEEYDFAEHVQQWGEKEREGKAKAGDGKEGTEKQKVKDNTNAKKAEMKQKVQRWQQGSFVVRGRHQGADLLFAQQVLQSVVQAATAVQQHQKHFLSPGKEMVWRFSIDHVEKVKSYAPKRYHYVVDIECRPKPS